MVNLIWVFLTVIGLVYAMFNGTMQEVNEAVFKGSKEAVTISIGLISVLVFLARAHEDCRRGRAVKIL
ncbi:hypothetical protein BsIDN1_40420 [Bacillus safensis]|uniref:Uncharacterized protein n=1 Tax=Bacillus safensis TaxID=561879 RepID=A0A5S9ME89_BACIA|nr:hypothetical protein BsIDN1_40420 [Bacillus safensis]